MRWMDRLVKVADRGSKERRSVGGWVARMGVGSDAGAEKVVMAMRS